MEYPPFTEIQMFSICSIWQVCVMLAYVVALFTYIPTSNIPQGCYLESTAGNIVQLIYLQYHSLVNIPASL